MSVDLHSLKAVLFDFDGTLADSYQAITASVNHVRAAHDLPPLSEAEVRPHVGRGPASLLEHTVPGVDLAVDWPRYRAHHPRVLESGTHLLPGAAEALAALKARGLAIGVCSNKPREFTRRLLDYLGLGGAVDLVLGPEDVERPKPAPDMLLAALARLGLKAEQVLYLGDMVVDIDTARAAGLRVWVLPTGSEERERLESAHPDRLLRDLTELARLARED
jgi:phosphoglycolate phosphatase